MNAAQLLAHFETISEAPDAIARLRRFILDLAVRGKLVPQDRQEEPVSELLAKICEAKARRIGAGDVRKPRELSGQGNQPQPFDIPVTWQWVRLDTVGAIVGGGTPAASEEEHFTGAGQGIPWLTPADLGGYADLYIAKGARDLTEKGLHSSSATLMPANTVLFSSRAPIGYVAISSNPIATNQGFKSIVPYISECARFIALAMKAFAPEINAKAPGTTFKEVSGKIVAAVPLPLPPLPEQHRIVARVDELMALCDQLEAQQCEREARRDRLAAASLARLNAPDLDTFKDDACFTLDVLPALISRPDLVKQLRQTILNLATQGKLVPQDITDGSASAAIWQLEQAGLDRQVRRNVPENVDLPASYPNDALPESWTKKAVARLLRLGVLHDLKDGNHGANHPKVSDFFAQGTPFITAAQVSDDGAIDYDGAHKLAGKALASLRVGFAQPGDVIYTHKGSVGRVAVCDRNCVLSPQTTYYRCDNVVLSNQFLRIYMLSDAFRLQVNEVKKQTTRDFVPIQTQYEFFIRIPPRAEQDRIVTKTQELISLCDRLETSLHKDDEARRGLLNSILADALQPAEKRDRAA